MTRVPLGRTGLQISPLVYGTLPLGPLQARLSAAEGGKLIRYALEQGVNLLDTAELYGTYEHIRHGIAGFSGEVLIASKTHAADATTARAHVERALREMGRERLDIVHLHGARLQQPFVERSEVFAELLKMRDEGKIAQLGLSTHYVCAVYQAAEQPDVEVIHPLINRQGMGIIDGSADEMATAIAAASQAGKGIYAMKALAGGNLIDKAREHIRYVAGLPGVDALALGMTGTAEIDANLALLTASGEDEEAWHKLEQRRRKLVIMEQFCKGCGACVPACTNDALQLVEGKAKVDEENCILCGYCGAACPEFMIRVV
ncbi:MAG: aldo/keto reductase [Desulfuromonas sp.]|nr:MAG: aldo/keto reductase [Desulfuromonas sp.]